jgi:hypothetical protein
MLFIIVPAVAFIIVFLYWWIFEDEPGWGAILGILLACLGTIFVLITSIGFTGESNMQVGQIDTYEIHALVDNASYEGHIAGNVFLISGYVDEELEYRYMYKVDGKGYAFGSIEADQCYLNTTSDTPVLEVRHQEYKNGFLRWAFGDPGVSSEYIFFLPEDAEIIDEFKIDFK